MPMPERLTYEELIDRIVAERRRIQEALEVIEEYSDRLRKAAADAQQKLIGK